MRYAIVKDGEVLNVIAAESDFAAAEAERAGGTAVESDSASVGDTYSGGGFARPEAAPVVPQSVTRRQAIQALRLAGKVHLVQPAIDAIADDLQRGLMQDEWDESLTFERQRPSLIALAAAIGLDAEDLDTLFITAGRLP